MAQFHTGKLMTCVAELHGWVSLMAGPIMSVTRTWPGSTVIIRVKPSDQRHKARAPRGTSSGAGRAHSVVGAGNTRVARVHPGRRRLPRPSGPPPNQQHKDARAARDEQRRGSCALGSWRRQNTSGAGPPWPAPPASSVRPPPNQQHKDARAARDKQWRRTVPSSTRHSRRGHCIMLWPS